MVRNTDGLIKINSKTAKEMGRKGGIASGVAKRRKANLKKAFEAILEADVNDKNMAKELKKMGFDNSNEVALAFTMVRKALKGDVRAFEQIGKITSIDTKDSLDREEQRNKIKAIELQNKKREKELSAIEEHGLSSINIVLGEYDEE